MAWMKDHDGKPDLTMLPYDAIANIAFVLSYGASKYSRDNWRDGDSGSYVAAALRHLHAYTDPSYPNEDSETGYSHLAHAGASILFAIALEAKEHEYDSEA